jgi:hypothetical protein
VRILNKPELDLWLDQARILGHDCLAIKGPALDGMTYEDGEPVLRPVNVAWRNVHTGDTIDIIYGNG